MASPTIQPIVIAITYLAAAMLLVMSHAMQETYSEDGYVNVSRAIGNTIEILIGYDVGLLILPLFIAGIFKIIYLLVSPLLNV